MEGGKDGEGAGGRWRGGGGAGGCVSSRWFDSHEIRLRHREATDPRNGDSAESCEDQQRTRCRCPSTKNISTVSRKPRFQDRRPPSNKPKPKRIAKPRFPPSHRKKRGRGGGGRGGQGKAKNSRERGGGGAVGEAEKAGKNKGGGGRGEMNAKSGWVGGLAGGYLS